MSDGQMQAGWYYAQGDAPGTQRYWDGTQWVGGPQPVGGLDGGSIAVAGGGVPADWVQRFVAWLINTGIAILLIIALSIVVAVGFGIGDGLGVVLLVLAILANLGFSIWNHVIRQGRTGQSLGKTQQNIKLVRDDTGGPVGAGMALARWLIASLLSSSTCGLYGIVDVLWPLWDVQKKRLTDKILNLSVIEA
ncbi:MAG: RDD family protein [Acidimicrobiales bacterium]